LTIVSLTLYCVY